MIKAADANLHICLWSLPAPDTITQHSVDDLVCARRVAVRDSMHKVERVRTRLRVTVTHTMQPTEVRTT
jgi:hypothetical protein